MANTLPDFAGGLTRPNILRATVCALLGACLLLAGASAQAVDWLAPLKIFGGEEEILVWQGPGQYVKIVEQDRFKKYQRASKNDHPATISPKEMAAVLASISVRKDDGGGSAGPLFTPADVALLAPKVADALGKAQSDQDVVFGSGDTRGKSGRLTTAARIFVDEGALNIILGDTLVSGASGAEQAINHHEAPFRPGRRREAMDSARGMADGPGISFRPGNRSPRYDWAIINVSTAVAAYSGPALPLPAAPDAATAPEDTTKLLQERQQMREEMARMRKQMDEQGTAPAAAAPAPAALPPGGGAIPGGTRGSAASPAAIPQGERSSATVAAPPPAAPRATATVSTAPAPKSGVESAEQRLSVLQSLHAKKLITDEEYAAKRKAILEEL